jgi:type I restriction enzyme M protein
MNPKNESRITRISPVAKMDVKEPKYEHLIKLVNLGDVKDGQLVGSYELIAMNKKEFIRNQRYTLKENDIIVASRGTVPKVAILPEASPWEYILSNNFICVRLQNGYDPVFVKAFLESPLGLYFLEASRFGATVQSMTVEQLGKIMIPDLPLKEQKKIAQQLSQTENAYFEAINKAKNEYMAGYENLYKRMKIDQFLEPI